MGWLILTTCCNSSSKIRLGLRSLKSAPRIGIDSQTTSTMVAWAISLLHLCPTLCVKNQAMTYAGTDIKWAWLVVGPSKNFTFQQTTHDMAHCDMYSHVKINKHNSWHVRVFRWRSMMAMMRMRIRVRIIIRTIIIIFFIFIFIIIIIFFIVIFIFFFIIIFIFIFTLSIIITSLASLPILDTLQKINSLLVSR